MIKFSLIRANYRCVSKAVYIIFIIIFPFFSSKVQKSWDYSAFLVLQFSTHNQKFVRRSRLWCPTKISCRAQQIVVHNEYIPLSATGCGAWQRNHVERIILRCSTEIFCWTQRIVVHDKEIMLSASDCGAQQRYSAERNRLWCMTKKSCWAHQIAVLNKNILLSTTDCGAQ